MTQGDFWILWFLWRFCSGFRIVLPQRWTAVEDSFIPHQQPPLLMYKLVEGRNYGQTPTTLLCMHSIIMKLIFWMTRCVSGQDSCGGGVLSQACVLGTAAHTTREILYVQLEQVPFGGSISELRHRCVHWSLLHLNYHTAEGWGTENPLLLLLWQVLLMES